jgi:germination protein M
MNKKHLLLIIIVCLTMVFSACANNGGQSAKADDENNTAESDRRPFLQDTETEKAIVYYLTAERKWLVPTTTNIPATRQMAQVAVEKLLAGAPNDDLASPLPESIKLLAIYTINDTVYINLTKEFLNIKEDLVERALECLIQTTLSQAEQTKLQILIEGKTVDKLGDADISKPLTLKIINCNEDLGLSDPHITCYFSDEMGMYLVPISRKSTASNLSGTDLTNHLIEQTIDFLWQGPPEESSLYAVMPETGKLLNHRLEGDLLTLDFSSDFVNYSSGTSSEMLMTYALYYSCTAIPGINNVKILIDGQVADYLPGGTDISNILSPDEPLNLIQ